MTSKHNKSTKQYILSEIYSKRAHVKLHIMHLAELIIISI